VEKIHHTWSFGSDAKVLDDYALTTTTVSNQGTRRRRRRKRRRRRLSILGVIIDVKTAPVMYGPFMRSVPWAVGCRCCAVQSEIQKCLFVSH